MTNLDYWSDYTQTEKYATCMLFIPFFTILTDEYNNNRVGFIKDAVIKSMDNVERIVGAIFKNKTFDEIVKSSPVNSFEDIFKIIKSMPQSKKDKLINCFIKFRNDFDIMLIRSKFDGKTWIEEICNGIDYRLNYDAFN